MRKLGAIWLFLVGGVVLAAGAGRHNADSFIAGLVILVVGLLWLRYD
jgi:hypothetical protein